MPAGMVVEVGQVRLELIDSRRVDQQVVVRIKEPSSTGLKKSLGC